MSRGSRIIYLDVFRFILVSFALISHTIISFDIGQNFGEVIALLVKSLTRISTPALLILFGVMVELVYRRRYKMDRESAARNIIARAIICYILFISLGALALIFGKTSTLNYLGSLFFLRPIPLTNIFAIYAILLPASLALLEIDRTFGRVGLYVFSLTLIILDTAFLSGHPKLPYPFGHLGGFYLGVGEQWGPSILHALLLVVVGTIVSRAVFSEIRSIADRVLVTIIGMSSAIFLLSYEVSQPGYFDVLAAVAEYSDWRAHNHLGYYAFGILATLVMLFISKLLWQIAPAVSITQEIGRRTLTYFVIGNALLLISPRIEINGSILSIIIIIFHIFLTITLTLTWAYGPGRSQVVAYWNRYIERASTQIISKVRRLPNQRNSI